MKLKFVKPPFLMRKVKPSLCGTSNAFVFSAAHTSSQQAGCNCFIRFDDGVELAMRNSTKQPHSTNFNPKLNLLQNMVNLIISDVICSLSISTPDGWF
jgi:hypothetical protein